MGRYISGDIERKLWFAVQSSDAADRFGVIGYEPAYLEYQFEQDDLENETEIDDWSPTDTRDYITEIDYYL